MVRNTTVSTKEATYVEAARAIGAPPLTIMRKYLFGNVVQSVPVIGTLNAADALSTLAALGFLGFGIQPTEASEWGYDLSRALDDAQAGTWWPALFPGLAIILLITGLTLVGEGLNETLNPSLRRRRLNPVRMPPLRRRGTVEDEEGSREDRRRRHLRPRTCGSGTARPATPSAPSTGSASTSGPARSSDWWGSPAAASPRWAAGCWGCCPRAPLATASCSSASGTCCRLKPREQHALRGRELGLIFQEPLTRLNPLMRISEHFSETLKTHQRGITKDEIEHRSLEALRRWASRRPGSGPTPTSSPAACASA